MNRIFLILEWFNENYTAEEFIGVIFGTFVVTTIISIPVPQMTLSMSGFLFFMGVALCANFYGVAIIQRWYMRRTQKKLEDIDYNELVEDSEQSEEISK